MLVNVINDRFVEGYGLASFTKETTFNTELNDLRKIICLRKSEFLLKEFQFVMSGPGHLPNLMVRYCLY